jgi:outer membrane protein OmpA-like peptidoglycan-associated protein
MNNKFTRQWALQLVAAMALGTPAMQASAQTGYLTDKDHDGGVSTVVRSGTDLCWHTSAWTSALPDGKCDPYPMRKAEAPVVTPIAVAAAPVDPTPVTRDYISPDPVAPVVVDPTPVTSDYISPYPVAPVVVDPTPVTSDYISPYPVAPVVAAYVAPPVVEKIILSADTLFDNNKSVIKPAGKAALNKLAGKLEGNLRVVLPVGYTSSPGTNAYNMALSIRRANAVKAYLVSRGIDPDRIHPSGRGELHPVATNTTVAGRAENRRVEIEVLATQQLAYW